MSKNHRGKGILDKYKHGRGTCPICNRTGVKIVYEREIESKKVNICKVCNVKLGKNEGKKEKKQVADAAATATEGKTAAAATEET
jgi:hypothetical protein